MVMTCDRPTCVMLTDLEVTNGLMMLLVSTMTVLSLQIPETRLDVLYR